MNIFNNMEVITVWLRITQMNLPTILKEENLTLLKDGLINFIELNLL